jgi:hypothetical protein
MYIFRPIAAIIRFSSEIMVVVLYRIGIICDVCYMLLLRDTGRGGYLRCALSWDIQLKYVCSLLSYVSLQLLFVHFRCLLLVGFCYGLCACSLSFVSMGIFVSSPFSCMCVLVFHLGG